MAGTIKLDGTTFLTKDSSNNFALNNVTDIGSVTAGTIGSNVIVNTQDYCSVRVSALQTISHNTYVPIDFDTDEHDPNNWFNTTTYKFQPNKAGKYFVSLLVTVYANQGVSNNEITLALIKKNSTTTDATGTVLSSTMDMRSEGRGYNFTRTVTGFIDMNGSSDYLYNLVYFIDYEGNNTGRLDHEVSQFMAFRVGS